ncbi:cytochrome c biogenesis protein CcsA [Opitutales bacterium]|nr:cytochrome c biogenesis protein CcsA [Opitutales bacterium]
MFNFQKILFVLILFTGLYISFFPNTWTQASFFDFLKPNAPSSQETVESFDLESFSKIPVLRGGRVKPLDSVARNILLVLRNKRSALRVLEKDELENMNQLQESKNSLSEGDLIILKTFLKSKKVKIPQEGVEKIAVEVKAIDWLAQVLFAPEKADKLKTFLIDHDQVLGLLNQKLTENGKFYSYNELEPFLSNIDSSARKAGEVETELRDSFQQNIIELYRSLLIYKKLKHSLSPPNTPDRPEVLEQLGVTDLVYSAEKDRARSDEYIRFRKLTAELSEDSSVVQLGSEEFARVVFFVDRYNQANLWTEFLPIPPVLAEGDGKWMKVTESLVGSEPLESKEKQNMDPARFALTLRELLSLEKTVLKERISYIRENQKLDPSALFATQYAEAIKVREGVDPVILQYEDLAFAYRDQNFSEFNRLVNELYDLTTKRAGSTASTLSFEKTFNGFEPFYRSAIAYVVIFIVAALSWLLPAFKRDSKGIGTLRNSAYYLTIIVLICHTFGLAARMWIEGRPPVTNLYSSALFIGWASVLLCLGTEKYIRLGIASAMGALIGFSSLVIAHSLSLDSSLNPTGDTMEMMRAVLDSNFWLATHVVIITIGYSTTFLAGFLGIAYIFFHIGCSIFNKPESKMKKTLDSMIYGITCFSLLFSLVGTILGGIWADQSWGRFWGWDAKENGALLIVIWNALLLHARFSGIAKTRGLACIAIFGNIVTAWSWFGTNMLGVGLHSYGFMDKAFDYLMMFIISQLIIIGLAYLLLLWKLIFKPKDRKPDNIDSLPDYDSLN